MTSSILSAAWEGLTLVFAWPNILYPIAGTLLAMVVALLPGLTGAALMALTIPLTLSWDPLHIVLLYGALLGGATFMGSVTAILLNIPGTAPNAATVIDGYPLAQRGMARTALAASATASALGSTVGVVILIAVLPVVTSLIPRIGPAEYLLLAIWGLLAIGTIIRGSIAKGLAAAGLGLLVSFIGFDPRTADLRFTFGTLYLQDGLNLVPVFLGMFALAEVIDLSASGRSTISGKTNVEELGGSTIEGIAAVFRNPGLFLRSSAIGTFVGMIPGLGGTVAAFVAYGDAARTDRAGTMGSGDIRGVIAPEAANDAKDGGSLLLTLALGIPASAGTAVLLGVMAIHGIRPGQELMTDGLPLVFAMIWALFLSNWLTSAVGLAVVKPVSRLTIVRTRRLVPPILVLATLGALASRGRVADVWVAMLLGVVGYLMKKHHWPRIAFVMAFVLGPLFELNLNLTMDLQRLNRIDFWTRPSVIVLVFLIAVTTIPTWVRRRLPWR